MYHHHLWRVRATIDATMHHRSGGGDDDNDDDNDNNNVHLTNRDSYSQIQ